MFFVAYVETPLHERNAARLSGEGNLWPEDEMCHWAQLYVILVVESCCEFFKIGNNDYASMLFDSPSAFSAKPAKFGSGAQLNHSTKEHQ